MENGVTRFEDRKVRQEVASLAVEVYAASKDGKFNQDFGFRDQVPRAAVSIASNIAEGKERETIPEFIRYLYMAKGSVGELKTQLVIARESAISANLFANDLTKRTEKVISVLGGLIKALKRK